MDVDPEEEINGVDAGAMDNENEAMFDPHMSDIEDEEEYPVRPGQSKKRRRKAKDTTAEDEAQDAATPSRLHPRDPANFLKLCSAIKILVSPEVTSEQLEDADGLLRSYCLELVEVCHYSSISMGFNLLRTF